MPDSRTHTPTPDDKAAAHDFVSTLVPRADGHASGVYPLWHGWALMDAYLAGMARAHEANRISHDGLVEALRTIATMPLYEQDDMTSANMRIVARRALEVAGITEATNGK